MTQPSSDLSSATPHPSKYNVPFMKFLFAAGFASLLCSARERATAAALRFLFPASPPREGRSPSSLNLLVSLVSPEALPPLPVPEEVEAVALLSALLSLRPAVDLAS
jgi:hypothetical protein